MATLSLDDLNKVKKFKGVVDGVAAEAPEIVNSDAGAIIRGFDSSLQSIDSILQRVTGEPLADLVKKYGPMRKAEPVPTVKEEAQKDSVPQLNSGLIVDTVKEALNTVLSMKGDLPLSAVLKEIDTNRTMIEQLIKGRLGV